VSENEKKSGEQASNEAVAEATSTLKSMVMFVWDLGKVLFIAIALVFFVIRPFLLEPFVVSGKSMYPNFDDKDYLIIEKLSYRFGVPQRGDVLVFKYPLDPEQYFIKRIIGLPGEQVAVRDGRVYVYNLQHPNGELLDEKFLPQQGVTASRVEVMQIGDKDYFVMGDNREHSHDSRSWGTLPRADFVGKVWLRLLPLNEIGLPGHYSFNF
jgi:signal peptidase I